MAVSRPMRRLTAAQNCSAEAPCKSVSSAPAARALALWASSCIKTRYARLGVDKLNLPDLVAGFDIRRVYGQHDQIRRALEIDQEQALNGPGAGNQTHVRHRFDHDSQAILQP